MRDWFSLVGEITGESRCYRQYHYCVDGEPSVLSSSSQVDRHPDCSCQGSRPQ